MANFGETLKRERELRKISLREVTEATKIGLHYLKAMESNSFEQLPGGVFNKGFIRAYAKFIGLDAETLVNLYLYDEAHQLNPPPARARYAGSEPDDVPLPLPPAPTPVLPRRRSAALLTGVAAAIFILAAGAWLFLARYPAGARIDTPPMAQEPRLQQAGLLRPAPAETQATPEPGAPALRQDPPSLVLEDPLPAPASAVEKAPPSKANLAMFLGTTQTTDIVLLCDGVEKVRRDLAEGEIIAVACPGEVILSAGNAGALTLKINGHECLPLGEIGATLENFPLNARRAMEICPSDKGPR